ncbi:MAG: DolP-mannose mannosyltransferase [Elusimicrobiota bacterium]
MENNKINDVMNQSKYYVLFFFVFSILLALMSGGYKLPLLYDNQHYFYMSERVASGVPPHISHFDPKTALTAMISGSVIFLGRIIGLNDLYSAVTVSLSVMGAIVGLIWIVTYYLTGNKRASSFAAFSMLSYFGFVLQGAMGSRPKIFMILFMLLCYLFFFRKKYSYAGLFAGCAYMCWQPALIVFMSLLISVGLSDRNRIKKNIIKTAAGFFAVVILYELYFIFAGAIREQMLQEYYFIVKYMRTGEKESFGEALKRIRSIWVFGVGKFNFLPLTLLYAAVMHTYAAIRNKTLDPQLYSAKLHIGKAGKAGGKLRGGVIRKSGMNWFFIYLTMLGFMFFFWSDHQGYPDVLMILPFVAIMSGWSVEHLSMILSGKLSRAFRYLPHNIAVMILLVQIFSGLSKIIPPYTLKQQYELAADVKQLNERYGDIYSIGCTHLLAFNRYDNWLNYGFFFRGVDAFIRDSSGGRQFTPEKNGIWPNVILLSREIPEGIEKWLGRYTDITTELFLRNEIRVFLLKNTEKH